MNFIMNIMRFNGLKKFVKSNSALKSAYEYFFQRPILNYYNTNFGKRVLVSYSTYHFNTKKYLAHSNNAESMAIAEVFHEMGYDVDVFNNTYQGKVDPDKYDVIFGGGDLMFKLLTSGFRGRSIYYGTGSHPWQCTLSSLKRATEFFRKSRLYLENSLRLQSQHAGLAANFSDAVICIGNDHTVNTFYGFGASKVIGIDPSFYSQFSEAGLEKTSDANKNFLYFGSYGLLHKGLDLAVEAFRERPDLNLHVCGHLGEEKLFLDSLNAPQNIHFHGFLDISSENFFKLGRQCGFVILPSASEGTSTAVLTAMGVCGLIPVVTQQCGVDFPDIGFLIEELSVSSVLEAVDGASSTNLLTVKAAANRISQDTAMRYGLSEFKVKLAHALERVL
jgi:glycosyltransferase involved in cell wall biosynthesis